MMLHLWKKTKKKIRKKNRLMVTNRPPLTEKTEILQTDIKCRPCFRRTCKYGHYKCLRDITPEMAEDALLKLLSGGSEAGSGNA